MSIERVLITGGAGKLGSYVVDAAPEGMSITVFDTAPSTCPGPRHIQASVSDLADVSAAMAGHDAVVHLGAVPNQYEADAETTMAVNVQGTWNVFHAAELAGVRRVILGSSDSVVGVTQVPEEMQAPLYLPIDEAHPLRAVDPYGLSKVLGEKIGRSFAWRGRLEVVALRPAYILFPYLLDETIARGRNPASYECGLPPERPDQRAAAPGATTSTRKMWRGRCGWPLGSHRSTSTLSSFVDQPPIYLSLRWRR